MYLKSNQSHFKKQIQKKTITKYDVAFSKYVCHETDSYYKLYKSLYNQNDIYNYISIMINSMIVID